jgi:hypothetical protein
MGINKDRRKKYQINPRKSINSLSIIIILLASKTQFENKT